MNKAKQILEFNERKKCELVAETPIGEGFFASSRNNKLDMNSSL